MGSNGWDAEIGREQKSAGEKLAAEAEAVSGAGLAGKSSSKPELPARSRSPLDTDPWLTVFDEDELEEPLPEPTDFDLRGLEELEDDPDSGWSMAG